MDNYHTAYALVALVVSVYLSLRTDRKILSLLLIFWILAQPIMDYLYIIHLPGFDLTANRILLIALLVYTSLSLLIGSKNMRKPDQHFVRPPFEKYLYLYFLVVFISLSFNYSVIRPQDILAIPLQILTFIVVYLTAKNFATPKVIEAVIRAVVVLTVSGAIIAFVQYMADSTFLRTGEVRGAFGEVMRATGIFSEEYDFGAVQDLGVMVAIIRFRKSVLFYVLVPLLALSVVLTFHRMDIIVLAACLVAYFWIFMNPARKVALLIALSVLIVAYPMIGSLIEKNTIVTTMQGRIGQDTVTGRIEQFKVVAETILSDSTLLGMGSYYNKAYDKLMIKHGMVNYAEDLKEYVGFRVHNGFLEVGILSGIIAMILFVAVLFSMLIYFMKDCTRKTLHSAIPAFAVLIMILINMSNPMSSFNVYYSLLCAMLVGVFVAYRNTVLPVSKGMSLSAAVGQGNSVT